MSFLGRTRASAAAAFLAACGFAAATTFASPGNATEPLCTNPYFSCPTTTPTTTTPPAPPTTTTTATTTPPAPPTTTTTTTTTTPAPTPGPIAVPVFLGGFEAATFKPWGVPQSANYGYVNNANVHFGTFSLDAQTVGQGNYSGRFDLPAWSGGRTRSQVITFRPVNTGGDDYYSLMFYVPVGWTPGTSVFWGVSIAEFNFQNLGSGGPTIALQAHADHVTLVMQTGVATTAFPTFQFRSNADSPGSPNLPPLYAIPPGMQQGVWHELIVHSHWATDSSGLVEVWHRIKGQTTWTKTASLSGYPTLQTNPDGSYPSGTLDVLQAYRGASTGQVSVWLDGFSRSQSLATAAANLP